MSPTTGRLRIALDATPLLEPSGGIARYTTELVTALSSEFPSDEYWLLSDQEWERAGLPAAVRKGERPSNWLTKRWWLAGLPRELRRIGADIFHGTDFAVPYLPTCPTVLTVHDLSPWKSGDARAERAGRVRRRTPWLVRLATMVLTPSEAVRREVIDRFGLPASRVTAVPLAAPPAFRPRPEAEIWQSTARIGVSQPYLLFVGTTERRKNLRRLVESWREARRVHRDLSLAIVGRPGSEPFDAEPGLILAGLVPDHDVTALMAGAALFVFPSLYEGFGLPVLEAMQAGAPVVISRDAALLEVAGDAAVAVEGTSSAELTRAIVELMGDTGWRRGLRERGLRRAAEFSWRQTAIRTREIYVEAIRRF